MIKSYACALEVVHLDLGSSGACGAKRSVWSDCLSFKSLIVLE